MTIIHSLVGLPWPENVDTQLQNDPLRIKDALLEAQLLDMRVDLLRSRASVLFEMRLALGFEGSQAGVLIAEGLRTVSWSPEPRPTPRTAWWVTASSPREVDGLFVLGIDAGSDSLLQIRAKSAAFYLGRISNLDEIPDYTEASDEELSEMLPDWESEFDCTGMSFIGPTPIHFSTMSTN